MTLIITEPIKTVNAMLTKVLAARSQVLYQFAREDFETTFISPLDDGILLNMAEYVLEQLTIGDIIYVPPVPSETLGGVGAITHLDSGGAASLPRVGINSIPSIGGGTAISSYINNLTTKSNYRIAVEIFLDDGTPMFNTIFRYRPSQSGLLNVDFSNLLRLFLSQTPFDQLYYIEVTEGWQREGIILASGDTVNDDAGTAVFIFTGDITDILFDGRLIFAQFDGVYFDNWFEIITSTFTGGNTEVVLGLSFGGSTDFNFYENGLAETVQTDTLQALYSKKQLLKQGGANEWEGLLRSGTALTITDFTFNAINFAGAATPNWAAMGSIIVAEFTVGDVIKVTTDDGLFTDEIVNVVGIGGSTVTVEFYNFESDDLVTSAGTFIQSLGTLFTRFKNPLIWRGWNRTVSTNIDQEYPTRIGANNILLRQNIVDVNKVLIQGNDTYQNTPTANPDYLLFILDPSLADAHANAFYLEVFVRDNSSGVHFSETLFFELRNECPNAIMLDWINSRGGVDQWLFGIDQLSLSIVDDGILAERPVTQDIEFVTRTKQRFPGAERQRITCVAEHLTFDQLTALKEIKETNSLRVYLRKDGNTFIDAVVVTDFTTPFNTKDRQHRYAVTIEFPDEFDFFDAKLY